MPRIAQGVAISIAVLSISFASSHTVSLAETRNPVGGTVAVSGRVDLVNGRVVATIRNNHKLALEAWTVTVVYDTSLHANVEASLTHDTFLALGLPHTRSDIGPLLPNESRDVPVSTSGITVLKSVTVTFALFSDLTHEGTDTSAHSFVLSEREKKAEELGRWISVLSTLDTLRPDAGVTLLKRELARDPSGSVAHTVAQLLGDPGLRAEAIQEMKGVFERQRQLALRHRRR